MNTLPRRERYLRRNLEENNSGGSHKTGGNAIEGLRGERKHDPPKEIWKKAPRCSVLRGTSLRNGPARHREKEETGR